MLAFGEPAARHDTLSTQNLEMDGHEQVLRQEASRNGTMCSTHTKGVDVTSSTATGQAQILQQSNHKRALVGSGRLAESLGGMEVQVV